MTGEKPNFHSLREPQKLHLGCVAHASIGGCTAFGRRLDTRLPAGIFAGLLHPIPMHLELRNLLPVTLLVTTKLVAKLVLKLMRMRV